MHGGKPKTLYFLNIILFFVDASHLILKRPYHAVCMKIYTISKLCYFPKLNNHLTLSEILDSHNGYIAHLSDSPGPHHKTPHHNKNHYMVTLSYKVNQLTLKETSLPDCMERSFLESGSCRERSAGSSWRS